MLPISVLAFVINAFIVAKAITFFYSEGSSREADKTIVGTTALISVLFMLAQATAWLASPGSILNPSVTSISGPLFMAYNLAASVVFLTHIRLLTVHRDRACQHSQRRG